VNKLVTKSSLLCVEISSLRLRLRLRTYGDGGFQTLTRNDQTA